MQIPNYRPNAGVAPVEIEVDLARWYSAQPTIRRLVAIDSQPALTIFVTLEPTADGSDPFPIWFAMQGKWIADLRTLANRDVQLQLVAPEMIDDTSIDSDVGVIADICWRDPFATA